MQNYRPYVPTNSGTTPVNPFIQNQQFYQASSTGQTFPPLNGADQRFYPYAGQQPQFANQSQNAQANGMPNSFASATKAHLVSSIEEARAMRVDFDGSLLVCINVNNSEVYTKQMLQNGSVLFTKGTLVPEHPSATTAPGNETSDRFDDIVSRLTALEDRVCKNEGGKVNGRNKSNATDTAIPVKSEPASDTKTNGRE